MIMMIKICGQECSIRDYPQITRIYTNKYNLKSAKICENLWTKRWLWWLKIRR